MFINKPHFISQFLVKGIASIVILTLLGVTACTTSRPMLLEQKDVDHSDNIYVLYLKDSTVVEFPLKSGRFDNQKNRYYSTRNDSIYVAADRVQLANVERHEIGTGGILFFLGIIAGTLLIFGVSNLEFNIYKSN